MKLELIEYIERIDKARLLEGDLRETTLFEVVSELLDLEPGVAAISLWAKYRNEDDVYLTRLISYALAKASPTQHEFLWGPLGFFVTSPFTSDESTLINLLTSLQLHNANDDLLASILAPEFLPFTIHCLEHTTRTGEAFCDLLLNFHDRELLIRLLSAPQVDIIRRTLRKKSQLSERSLVTKVLGTRKFDSMVPDGSERIRQEQVSAALLKIFGQLRKLVKTSLMEILTGVLQDYATLQDAKERGGRVQELRFYGQDPSKGRLRGDVFEGLMHAWQSAVRESLRSLSSNVLETTRIYVLAPERGSFILRFFVETPDANLIDDSFSEIMNVVEKPERFLLDPVDSHLNAQAIAHLTRFMAMLTDKRLDVKVGFTDAHRFVTRRVNVTTSRLTPIINAVKQTRREEVGVQREVAGILEGGNHPQGTFEIRVVDDDQPIRGTVPQEKRSQLLNKVLGHHYRFGLERRRPALMSNDQRVRWLLLSVEPLEETDPFVAMTSSSRSLGDVSSSDVPQQDRIDRIVEVIRALARGDEVSPASLDMNDSDRSIRHIGYMKHAAKILGLLGDDGSVLSAGHTLAELPPSRVNDFLSMRFEVSHVAKAWKNWAGVSELTELQGESAVQFLKECRLSASMAKRRGRTLAKWLAALKPTHS